MSITANEVVDKLKRYKNIILYGPPGTGKTHLLNEVLELLDTSGNYDYFNTSAPIAISNTQHKEFSYEWCTFHPNYAYENFVVGLDPVIKDGKLGYKHHIGPFTELVKRNAEGQEVLLVIDEINRANTEDVFGNTIALLDLNDRETNSVSLNDALTIDGVVLNELKVNNHFYVIGTMNSLDKSVSPLDISIKRRFITVEVEPNVDVLKSYLEGNPNIGKGLTDFVVQLFSYLNYQLNEYVGKEYEMGQGYFWGLMESENEGEATDILADILKYKVLPHLKDVFPNEYYIELFTMENLDKLFHQTDFGYEMLDFSTFSSDDIINLMASACGSSYRIHSENAQEVECTTFEEYQESIIADLYKKLKRHKNVILTGSSGTGKSSLVKIVMKQFEETKTMHWHSSTAYEDVLEGISAKVDSSGNVDYVYKSGKLLELAHLVTNEDTLMVIEGLDRSNAAENFGELITLLEPDKREKVSIKMHDSDLVLPKNMHLICTMNPLSLAKNKLDSALKRRFVIIDLYPDYELLRLWFSIEKKTIDVETLNDIQSREDLLSLAIGLLKGINERITNTLGLDYQLGHSVFWNLKDERDLSINTIFQVFDAMILPTLQDYINDEEVAQRILGESSPLIKTKNYGFEISSFAKLSPTERIETLKGFYVND
ncbi:dynein-related subfamily AAA family protein [Ureibacillus xyleni]|uniref:Dynein-related subfamily AAA family protein n=1 Tax=Ureibacillus xyleni TaxID=614648 RepID=A0A285SSK7_9BACL|nr:AAA family ATPase [Ureibacillus xyleni]SOC11347.1 dynein-related subfamily AAA family protein [Ureibacillus xyleni]